MQSFPETRRPRIIWRTVFIALICASSACYADPQASVIGKRLIPESEGGCLSHRRIDRGLPTL
jgi:hypothetical protein